MNYTKKLYTYIKKLNSLATKDYNFFILVEYILQVMMDLKTRFSLNQRMIH